MMRRLPPTAWAWTPGTLTARGRGHVSLVGAQLVRAAQAARAGGIEGLLLREPHLQDAATLEIAAALREVFDGGWFGIHDRMHLASAVGGDGVHLGRGSLTPTEARRVVGDAIAIGVSTHAGDAIDPAADFATYGPLAAPISKPASRDAVGATGLATFANNASVPVWALGGVDATALASLPAPICGGAFLGALWGTGDAWLDGSAGPLDDVQGIERRARELARAASRRNSA